MVNILIGFSIASGIGFLASMICFNRGRDNGWHAGFDYKDADWRYRIVDSGLAEYYFDKRDGKSKWRFKKSKPSA